MQYLANLTQIVRSLPVHTGPFLERDRKMPLMARNFEKNCNEFGAEIIKHAPAFMDELKTVVVNNFMVRKGEEDESGIELFVDYVVEYVVRHYPPNITDSELRREMRNISQGLNFEEIHKFQKECNWSWIMQDNQDYISKVPEPDEILANFERNYQACLSNDGYEKPSGLVKMYTTGGFLIEVTYSKEFTQVACGFSALSFLNYSYSDQMYWS